MYFPCGLGIVLHEGLIVALFQWRVCFASLNLWPYGPSILLELHELLYSIERTHAFSSRGMQPGALQAPD